MQEYIERVTDGEDLSLEEARALLERWNVTGAPVMRDGELEGILSLRDIARADEGGRLQLPVSSHMSHQPVLIQPEEPLEDALDLMTQEDIGRLPVCDGERLIGIITRTDILSRLYSEG